MPCTTRSGGVHDCHTALSVEGVTPQHWRVTLDHRPIKVNRVVPDDEADRIARRIASFDKRATAETKAFVDTTPAADELPPALAAFFVSAARPATQARMAPLASPGLGRDSEPERRLRELIAVATRCPHNITPTDVQGVDP
ncbi:hypothetical protein [Kribbella sp. NBC_00359]|uniref:hypothetical protein n=1 Tax=Kribbella sp. NBC_00359 TaxID=2975966 RepID=UPI002E1B4A6A